MNPAEAAAAYETKTFKVTHVGTKEKAGSDPIGYVELQFANTKGTSKIRIVGEETLINEYRVGEYYEMTLNQVKAPGAL